MKKILLLITTIFYYITIANAQAGRLDPSFGGNGIVKTDLGKNYNYQTLGKQVLIQQDGSIYLILQTGKYQDAQAIITKRHSDGSVDSSYGINGFSANAKMLPSSAMLQSDGKVVLVGAVDKAFNNYDLVLARFNATGSLDSSFSNDGIYISNAGSNNSKIALQSDGKLLVFSGASISRYDSNGNPDSTFSGGRILTDNFSINEGAIQSDGKIVVAGNTLFYSSDSSVYVVARYNTDGSLDKSFGNDGKQITRLSTHYDFPGGMVIQKDGKILVGGGSLIRYNSDGRLDSSFSADGIVTTSFYMNYSYFQGASFDQGYSINLQSDGKIVVAGDQEESPDNNNSVIVRYNTNGSEDKTFSGDGKQLNDFKFASAVIEKDGKILVGGYDDLNFALARYTANGTPDNTFKKDGKLTGSIPSGNTIYNSSLVQKDGKLVAAGRTWNGRNFDFAIARYNSDGTLDNTFSIDGAQTTDFASKDDYARAVAIQGDGKIVVVGYSGNASLIVRYNTDGSLDKTFSNDGKQQAAFGLIYSKAESVAIQSDGKIVVVGNFGIARYNIDGSLDKTFDGDGRQTGVDYASSIVIQNDGKIVVGGVYSHYTRYERLNNDGSQDSTFGYKINWDDIDIGGEVESMSLALQNDGKIVIVNYSFYRGDNYNRVNRVTADGKADSSFLSTKTTLENNEYVFNNPSSVAIQSDGKVVVSSGGVLTRYLTNGNFDSTFGSNGIKAIPVSERNISINSIAISGNELYGAGSANSPGAVGLVARYLLDDNKKSPPTVSLTTPTINATYLAPAAHIKLSAAAADKDGTISKVEFYNGTTLLHTETVDPYGFVWRNVPLGNYTLTAKAYDNSGLVTTSAPVHISVVPNKPPTVSIINPANNQSYPAPATIHLEAAAKDPDGRITKVEFYNGSTLLQTELKPPYTFAWRNVPVGNYAITAKATDNWGAVTTSAVIRVSVHPNIAPTVSITSPANGESFAAPATIDLAASARDADGRITKVEFYNGTVLLRTERKLPYSYHWQNVPAGTYTITAVATDNYGLKTTSAAVKVTVTNAMIVSRRLYAKNDKTALNDALQLSVFPNPARGIVNISTSGLKSDKPATLSIFSASGVEVKTMQLKGSSQTIQINVSPLSRGVYMIKVISEGKAAYKQFVKL